MRERGDIYLSKYSGWYSVRDEAYYDEGELARQPTEPGLRRRARRSSGSRRRAISSGSPPTRTGSWPITRRTRPSSARRPAGTRSSASSAPTRDLSISRTTFDWGLPVPGDPKHVMYVWVDALNNYVTGAGFPDENDPRWRNWPADLHIIGKDIVRFHTVYWPAFLMSAKLALPKRVFGHGFLFNRGEKMSKSVGNVIDPFSPPRPTASISCATSSCARCRSARTATTRIEAIVNRINADLANDLGNLAQRSPSMIARTAAAPYRSRASSPRPTATSCGWRTGCLPRRGRPWRTSPCIRPLAEIWAVVAEANRYFASQEPWSPPQARSARMATVLYVAVEVLRAVGIMVQPIVPPTAAGKLLELLAVPAEIGAGAGRGRPPADGAALPQPQPIFPRYVEAEAE